MATETYTGLLCIGDPHLEGRVPGFRKDDYPQVILGKLRWSLDYATTHHLLPVILGDVFHLPRDNPNWMLSALMEIMDRPILGIYGNHDCSVSDHLDENDSLTVLARAGRILLLDNEHPWEGQIGGRPVVVGGTPRDQWPPKKFDPPADALVFWITHHDIIVPGYEEQGHFRPRDIPGIDAVINGHIHRKLETVRKGDTVWITPGNIARRSRSDAVKAHIPSVLHVDVTEKGWEHHSVPVPHAPFEDVFHEAVAADETAGPTSSFISGLKELQARRTETGAGLDAFLMANRPEIVKTFGAEVADYIETLKKEVVNDGA